MNSYQMDWDNGKVWQSHSQQVMMEEEERQEEERPMDFDTRMQELFKDMGAPVSRVITKHS